MSHRVGLAALAMLFCTAVSRSTGAPAQLLPQFRARTDVVSVPVAVTKGRDPVTGLTANDFELTDNGVRQTVDAASLETVPIDVTLVLTDFSPDRDNEFRRTLGSAAATRKLLHAADRLRIVVAEDDITGKVVGDDYNMATDPAIKEIEPGIGLANGFKITANQGKLGWGVALGDALFYALAWPVAPDRRHVVIAFTDGWDTASTIEMDTLPKLAARSDAVLHAVLWATPQEGPGSGGGLWTSNPGANSRQWEASYRAVDQTVQRTGGKLMRTNKAPEALAELIADFRSSYVLRFTPRDVPAAGWHELRVALKRPGSFTIRARKGYEGR